MEGTAGPHGITIMFPSTKNFVLLDLQCIIQEYKYPGSPNSKNRVGMASAMLFK